MKLRALPIFPSMRCDEGCTSCCGAFPVAEADFQRLRRIVRERGIETVVHADAPDRCPFFSREGRCLVYDDRPAICRVFGHIEELECPRGYNVNVPTEPVRAALQSRGTTTRLLHEIAAEQHPGLVDIPGIWASLAEEAIRPDFLRRIPTRKVP